MLLKFEPFFVREHFMQENLILFFYIWGLWGLSVFIKKINENVRFPLFTSGFDPECGGLTQHRPTSGDLHC